MTRRRYVTVGVLAMMIGGCDPVQLDPVEPGSGDTAPEQGSTEPSAIAIYGSQMSGSSYEVPADDLLLFFSSTAAQSCTDPWISGEDWCQNGEAWPPGWQFVVLIPPDLVHPGVIHLGAPGFVEPGLPVTDSVEIRVWENCKLRVGGFAGFPGTLEISSIDATSISVNLDNEPQEPVPDMSGHYTATFCP